ncbi:casein kinase I delta [Suillus subalutaceus]|uniref:casein kinase I delta n=1 Tax=Suillus subalutaceus TaxID=48586 RepID=UPI001B85FFA7|nr:casein kinase I delta [Suillus subalutaceus]KAG1835405.1 casein kinase I delta [Suillus subalutaceus]
MDKVPIRVDGRFRLGDILGSGSYGITEYNILKHLEGGVGIPRALWFGRESTYHALVLDLLGPSLHSLFLSHSRKFSLETVINLGDQLVRHFHCLEYVHSHNYIHGDIKPQNVVLGLGDLRHTAFIIDFGIVKEFWNMTTSVNVSLALLRLQSINNHLGVEPGRRDDLESLTYMLIYFLQGSLPWLIILPYFERKVNTTIEDLCRGIPVEFATMLIYTCSLAFSEEPDYNHLRSLLHTLPCRE